MRLQVHGPNLGFPKGLVITLLFLVPIAVGLFYAAYLSSLEATNARHQEVRSLIAQLTHSDDAAMECDLAKTRRMDLIQDIAAGKTYHHYAEFGASNRGVESKEEITKLVQSVAEYLQDEADQLVAVAESLEEIELHLPLLVRVAKGEPFADSELPKIVPVMSSSMAVLLGWVVGSVLAWTVLCWVFGLACGYHPWSMPSWDDDWGERAFLIFFVYVLPAPTPAALSEQQT